MKPIHRHHAREYAVQAIYQWQLSKATYSNIEQEFLSEHITQEVDLDYFKELLREVMLQSHTLDQQITPYLNRSFSELDPIELAILRIAVYELLARLEINYRIIINEALELAKKFGSVEGYKFINGILDQVARQLRALEVEAKKNNAK